MEESRNLLGCQVFDESRLPSDWECVPIGDRVELAYGRALQEHRRESGPVTVFGSNGPVGTHNQQLCQGPGILVGRKGTVGAVHFSHGPFWPIDTVYYVVPKQQDNLKYLYYLLQYLPLKNLNAATGVPGLSRRDAYALRGAFPPKEEQRQITMLLETVDTAIESIAGATGLRLSQEPLFGDASNAAAISKAPGNKLEALIDLRRSLMHDLFTGRVRVKCPVEAFSL